MTGLQGGIAEGLNEEQAWAGERDLFWLWVALVLLARYACHALMLLAVLVHEGVPAPHLPDLVLDHVPYVAFLARWNYVLWLLCYIPGILFLGWRDRRLFLRLVLLDGALALVRGVCVSLTGLGPTLGTDLPALHPIPLWSTWTSILNPVSAILSNTAGIYLTQDLFFSGHIATTFLIYLCSRRLGRVAWVFLGMNLFTLAVVFLAHLHYAIDVVGAYAITYAVYRVAVKVGWMA